MAKKVVATLKSKDKIGVTKVIRAIKNRDSGSYSFKEDIVPGDQVEAFLKGEYKK
ncbi:MAG: DUF4295 domain-containing protein [Bacteroidia bacterium]|nr:DUF4295 domain-containing protein [Bacteroidia bacterium]